MSLLVDPTTNETYTVTASTLAEVVRLLTGAEAGECNWSIGFEHEGVGRDGKPTGLLVKATVKITMPVWVGRDTAKAAERTEWDRFRAALQAHENGHDTRARTGMQQLHDKLLDTRASRLGEVFEAEKARIQRESNAYDRATNHGMRPPPGTVITIPP